jgi:hypothetical protein
MNLLRNITRSNLRIINNIRTFSIKKIPLDTDKYSFLLGNLKMQKFVSGFAWIFYPGISILTGIPCHGYSLVCSSIHSLAVKDIVRQIGNKYLTDGDQNKKFWIKDNELIISELTWKNFWWETYNLPKSQNSNNVDTIDYIDMNPAEQKFVNHIIKNRQNRVRIGMGSIIAGCITTAYFNNGPLTDLTFLQDPFFMGHMFSGATTYLVINILICQFANVIQPTDNHERPSIVSDNNYFYINMFRNIVLTNYDIGYYKRYKTNTCIDK